MAKIKKNNVVLFYECYGSGTSIIFTHGASWNHKQWQSQVEFFKEKYQVVLWDVRGHGYSSLPKGSVDSEDFAIDLIELMDHLKIKEAILCGLSMGGHISLQTTIRYPKRVTGLILIGTPCSNTFNLYEKIFVPINRLFSKFISMKISGKIQAKILSKFNPSNYEYIIEAFSMIEHDDWNRIWRAVTKMESKDDLGKVKCPTLLLVGEHDTMTRYQQPYINKQIRNSELKIIPHAHHATSLDNPAAVNHEILNFITELEKL